MKKIASVLLVVVLVALFMATGAFAEETTTPQIVIDSVSAAPGEEVRVMVSMTNISEALPTNGVVVVSFDETGLELVDIDCEEETTWKGMVMANVEERKVSLVNPNQQKKDCVLFEIIFKIKEDAVGAYEVNLSVEYFLNDAGDDVVFEVVSGTVTAACPCENIIHVEAVEPGCHYTGNIEYWYCADCLTVWQDEARTQLTNMKNVVLPATGSENVVHFEAVEPGCHSMGNVEYWYCPDCEGFWTDEACTQVTNSRSVNLPAKGSENVVHFEAVEPACHYKGNIEYWYCPDCEGFWTDEACTQVINSKSVTVPALGGETVHVEAKDPTCYEEGNIEHWYCEECLQVWQDEALTQLTNFRNVVRAALDHNIIHMEAVEPGCHYEGNIEHWYCTLCDTVWQDEALTQLTNHKNVVVPALGGETVHVEAKTPTCLEEGNIEYWYCEECLQVWQDEALTQLTNIKNVNLGLGDHVDADKDAVCDVCGQKMPTPETGDAIYVAVATALVSMMSVVALTKKKEF